ncbi:BQ5605_C036g11487 [Microbotryum silenes-dioicae]|uniref:phenylalanine--tRNA ligase n=1 Tax=Microbotryum silenes-dioicae TaxID=796604 RepID=A0A2X0N221_9BASI|nr:BQ5605_C036g11487 [Microbotryum silenes-dioicae]
MAPTTLPMPSSDLLQSIVLHALDAESPLTDSRVLPLSLPAAVEGAEALVGYNARPVGDGVEEQNALKAALDSLVAKEMISCQQRSSDVHFLSLEGASIADAGSHEYLVWSSLDANTPLSAKEIEARVGKDVAKVGQGKAMKNKWVKKQGDGFVKAAETVHDATREQMIQIKTTGTLPDEKELADLRKRKLIEKKKTFYFSIDKGLKFATTIEKLETDLTVELLNSYVGILFGGLRRWLIDDGTSYMNCSGAWEKSNFKKYNFEAEGAPTNGGALHPLMKVREEFRNIFFEMGFTEMPTNRFVESGFWNFDALYVPQQHPAREVQDTFYLKDPVASSGFPQDYYERVKKTHEVGGYGSTGYCYPFSKEETSRLVLRTHTTSVSAAMLYKIANQPGGFKPSKLFSIDRVFRNETVDATHLAEFHQVEGVIADYNLTLADLIGFMEVFFKKMGVTNLRFKPAYNPYTEPSLEIFSWHQGLNKWVEIGNSGMFRPEMLEPMGLPADVRVHGWGLSLERPTMIRYGISNIRDLLGHKVPLEMIEKSAAVRFSTSA